ncbi:MAG: hypothetical protein ACT4PU_12570 [Planctomycetota bacterium]
MRFKLCSSTLLSSALLAAAAAGPGCFTERPTNLENTLIALNPQVGWVLITDLSRLDGVLDEVLRELGLEFVDRETEPGVVAVWGRTPAGVEFVLRAEQIRSQRCFLEVHVDNRVFGPKLAEEIAREIESRAALSEVN